MGMGGMGWVQEVRDLWTCTGKMGPLGTGFRKRDGMDEYGRNGIPGYKRDGICRPAQEEWDLQVQEEGWDLCL